MALGAAGPFGIISGRSISDPGLYAIPAESLSDPMIYLTRAHFEPFLNTMMRGSRNEAAAPLRLVEASDDTSAMNQKIGFNGESFTLIFEPVSRKAPGGGRYDFEHPSLGRFSLDLLPFGKDGRLQAIINRISN